VKKETAMGVIGRTLKFTLGLALGAGIGAAAALLVAPQSGKVSVEQIQARIDEMVNAGKAAQNEREKELLAYWEQQLALKEQKA
jgi:gas vesicle protein